jgi:hypothetical protein
MSRQFSHNSAKSSFMNVNESLDASEYIKGKKIRYSFCTPNICHPNKNINTESNLLLLKQANRMAYFPCSNFEKTQLYANLYTKLDLSDLSGNTPVISDLSGNVFPATIDTNAVPYLTYNIDASGVLFGNSPCSIDNYLNYVTYDVSFNGLI